MEMKLTTKACDATVATNKTKKLSDGGGACLANGPNAPHSSRWHGGETMLTAILFPQRNSKTRRSRAGADLSI